MKLRKVMFLRLSVILFRGVSPGMQWARGHGVYPSMQSARVCVYPSMQWAGCVYVS